MSNFILGLGLILLPIAINLDSWKLTLRDDVWFWFHFVVKHDLWVLLVFIWSCQRGEMLHGNKKQTSYIPGLHGKTGNARLEQKVPDITGSGGSQISFLSEFT